MAAIKGSASDPKRTVSTPSEWGGILDPVRSAKRGGIKLKFSKKATQAPTPERAGGNRTPCQGFDIPPLKWGRQIGRNGDEPNLMRFVGMPCGDG